ncbi:hypothetical protein K466DRAFT_508228, partial [Polyporus arcularius HHB13444]
EGLRESVGDHVVRGAIHETYLLVFDDPANEMEADVDVFSAGVVLVVASESNRRLVVGVQRDGVYRLRVFKPKATDDRLDVGSLREGETAVRAVALD